MKQVAITPALMKVADKMNNPLLPKIQPISSHPATVFPKILRITQRMKMECRKDLLCAEQGNQLVDDKEDESASPILKMQTDTRIPEANPENDETGRNRKMKEL